MSYRRGRGLGGVLYAYLAQTSIVGLMVVYSTLNVTFQPGVIFAVIGNHMLAGLGLLVCASLVDEQRGHFANAALVIFAFCMLGLPPRIVSVAILLCRQFFYCLLSG